MKRDRIILTFIIIFFTYTYFKSQQQQKNINKDHIFLKKGVTGSFLLYSSLTRFANGCAFPADEIKTKKVYFIRNFLFHFKK